MVGRVDSFFIPNRQSYYVNPQAIQQVVQALDNNRDGRLGRDELDISPQLLQQIDRNRDRVVSLFEMEQALSENKVSLRNFDLRTAQALAQAVMGEWAYADGFGSLGRVLDVNNDGYVNRRELVTALNRGNIILSGSYLTAENAGGYPGYPGGPGGPTHPGHPGQGWGVDAPEAREHVQQFEANKMKKDRWGNYDPSTGIFKPEEANQKINQYLEDKVIASRAMSLRDKFDLLKGQKMQKDRWGNDDPAVGSLTGQAASQLAEKAAKATHLDERQSEAEVREFLQAVAGERMKADRWGNDDYTTGLLTPAQANQAIKDFLRETVLEHRRLSSQEKLELIKGQAMSRDRWGNYDPRTGALTAEDVNELSKKVFEQGQRDRDPFGKDPFDNRGPLGKIGDILDKDIFGKDPFKK